MSTKQLPIDYKPSKRLYLASLGYGSPKISLIFVYRETEKMYLVHRDSTESLIGWHPQIRGLSQIKKDDVHAFETLLEALKWLQNIAVDRVAVSIVALAEAEDLVIQIDACVKAESKQQGAVVGCLSTCFAKKGAKNESSGE